MKFRFPTCRDTGILVANRSFVRLASVRRSFRVPLAALLILAAVLAAPAAAAPADLDPTFGTGGVVTTLIGSSLDYARAVAIQQDGKIVAAGTVLTSVASFAVVRYSTDGSLDAVFGAGGKVITSFGAGNSNA